MTTHTTYDAFMSYSHSTDADLAPVLQRMICRVGRPWFRRDVLSVFRDSTSLVMTDNMWRGLVQAMSESRYFVLMASPAAAASPWVAREIAWWLEHRGPSTLLVVLTEGVISWDSSTNDFDWTTTTSLPETVLRGVFTHEPLWEDVSGARGLTRRGQVNVRLRDAARTIAAALYGMPKEQVDGEDERESRRALRFRRGAVSGLALLLVAALVAAVIAFAQRDSALRQLRVASAQAIAAESQNLGVRDPARSARLAMLAYRTDGSAQTMAALMSAVERNRHVTAFLESSFDSEGRYADGREGVTRTRHSPDGRLVAGVSSQSGQIRVWDVFTHAIVATLTPQHKTNGNRSPSLVFLDDRRLAVLFTDFVDVWDISASTLVTSTPITDGSVLGIAPNGSTLATLGYDGQSAYAVNTRSPEQRALVASGPTAAEKAITLLTGKPSVLSLYPEDANVLIATTTDGRTAAVLVDYTRIELWDVLARQRRTSAQLPGEPGWTRVGISGDGRTVLAGNDKGEMLALTGELTTETSLGQMPASIAWITAGPDGRTGSVVDELGNVQLLSPLQDQRFRTIPAGPPGTDPNNAPNLLHSRDGRWLSAERPTGVTIVDVADARVVGTFPFDRNWPGEPVYFSPDGTRFSIVERGQVVTRALPSGHVVDTATASDMVTTARAIQRQTADAAVIALRNDESGRLIALWTGGEQILAEYAPDRAERAVEALRSGDVAVVQTTRADTTVLTTYRLHRDAAPTVLGTISRPDNSLDVALDDANGLLASEDAVLDTRSGTEVPLSGGNGLAAGTTSVFVDRGTLLVRSTSPTRYATGSIRTSLLVWDVAQGRLIGQWPEPASFTGLGPADAPLTKTDDTHVATYRPNGSIAVWDIGPESWITRMCGLAGELDEPSRRGFLGTLDGDVDARCSQ